MKKIALILMISLLGNNSIWGQSDTKDSINNLLKKAPHFTIYQDNYFMTGVSLNESINKNSADAKFQISFKERVTNATLPFDTFLYFTYTQKSFWYIYKNSSPFSETNYNPALGLGKFFINKHGLINLAGISLEHESNGKDSIYSRSWNRVSFHYMISFPSSTTLFLHAWIPFLYKTDNPDLMKHIGYVEANFTKKLKNDRFIIEIMARKGSTWESKGSLQTQISYRISKNNNQYLSIQYFAGYAENLLHYTEKTNMIRFGISFKPSNFFLHE
jgi:phospholipase A1